MGKGQAINKFKLDQWLKDYHWMINTVKELREAINTIGAKTAQYGIEATLPKASGGTSDPIATEVFRRANHVNRIREYEYKIMIVQQGISKVTGDREIEVLDRLLNGDSMRAIGKHMRLSATTIARIRENILSMMLS